MNLHDSAPAPDPSVPSVPSIPSGPSVPSAAAERSPLPWLLIIGLSSLALLWPLTALWGFAHGPLRALILLGLTAAVWLGAVVGGRQRRPVAVLALAGLLHGVLTLLLAGVIAGGDGPFGSAAALWTLLPSLASSTGMGALLGVVATGLQRLVGTRSGGSHGTPRGAL